MRTRCCGGEQYEWVRLPGVPYGTQLRRPVRTAGLDVQEKDVFQAPSSFLWVVPLLQQQSD